MLIANAGFVPMSKASENFKRLLGATYDPELDYQLVFPSSVPTKRRDGWTLVMEDADEILGQTLAIVARGRSYGD